MDLDQDLFEVYLFLLERLAARTNASVGFYLALDYSKSSPFPKILNPYHSKTLSREQLAFANYNFSLVKHELEKWETYFLALVFGGVDAVPR